MALLRPARGPQTGRWCMAVRRSTTAVSTQGDLTQAGRSPAPTATGVPAGKPVATAAASVSPPARSVDSAQDLTIEQDARRFRAGKSRMMAEHDRMPRSRLDRDFEPKPRELIAEPFGRTLNVLVVFGLGADAGNA